MKKLKLLEIPAMPGVYRFLNQNSEVIYVGKAKNLRRRLSQYQNAKRRKAHAKMRKIMKEARGLSYETTENELQALVRENELIQSLLPKWNVAGAFFYLYPMIGLRLHDQHLYLCYTTRPELFPEFNFHGAFRSRIKTRDGFFALRELLSFIGHAATRNQVLKSGLQTLPFKHTHVCGFRQIPETWTELFHSFFKGDSFKAVEELSILLLERPSALAKRKEIQEHLHQLRNWWRHEMLPLKKARIHSKWPHYPVPQKERDLLFIRLWNSSPLPVSTEVSVQSVSARAYQKDLP